MNGSLFRPPTSIAAVFSPLPEELTLSELEPEPRAPSPEPRTPNPEPRTEREHEPRTEHAEV